jgi:cytochrome c553
MSSRGIWFSLAGIFLLASLIAYVRRPRPVQQPVVFTLPQPQQPPGQPNSSYSRPLNWKPKMSRVATEGKYLYIQHCRTCHAEGGLGNTALAMKVQLRALGSREVQAQSDAELKQTILLGKGQMRGAAGLFGSNEADRLVAYLRTLSSANQPSVPQPGRNSPPPPGYQAHPPGGQVVLSFTYVFVNGAMKSTGSITHQGNEWIESGTVEGFHRYKEINRDGDHMYLLDQSTDYRSLAVPLNGGPSGIKRLPTARKWTKYYFLVAHYQ